MNRAGHRNRIPKNEAPLDPDELEGMRIMAGHGEYHLTTEGALRLLATIEERDGRIRELEERIRELSE